MAFIYKKTKLIRPHTPYLLITPYAHPNNCDRVKRKPPKRAHPHIWWATWPTQKQPQKTTKSHNGNNPKPRKEQKTGKKIDFFLTVSPCDAFKKSSKRT